MAGVTANSANFLPHSVHAGLIQEFQQQELTETLFFVAICLCPDTA